MWILLKIIQKIDYNCEDIYYSASKGSSLYSVVCSLCCWMQSLLFSYKNKSFSFTYHLYEILSYTRLLIRKMVTKCNRKINETHKKQLKELRNHILCIVRVWLLNTDKFEFFNLFNFPFLHLFNKSAFSTYSFGKLVCYLSVFPVLSACSEIWIQWDLYRLYNICFIIIYIDARSLWLWEHRMKATCKNTKIVL